MESHRLKRRLSAAAGYAKVRLALDFDLCCESVLNDPVKAGLTRDYQNQLSLLVEEHRSGSLTVEQVSELRKKLIHTMEILTAYTDCFQIYEYVLNRQERRFKQGDEIRETEAELAGRLMGYVGSAMDSAEQNRRIQDIIEQLPVRFTKNKFFAQVQEGLSVYKGGSKESLDQIFYMIETVSMVRLPDDMEEEQSDLWILLEELRKTDFKDLTQETYQKYLDILQIASERLVDLSGIYLSMEDAVNDLYILELIGKDGIEASARGLEEEETVSQILKILLNSKHAQDEALELMVRLEGKQESYYEEYLRLASAGEESELSNKIDILLSGSAFAVFDDVAQNSAEKVSEQELSDREEAYFEKIRILFGKLPKSVTRAVMAKVLSSLPVFFQSAGELEQYIANSLEACTDVYEKETSMELLNWMMENDDALV